MNSYRDCRYKIMIMINNYNLIMLTIENEENHERNVKFLIYLKVLIKNFPLLTNKMYLN